MTVEIFVKLYSMQVTTSKLNNSARKFISQRQYTKTFKRVYNSYNKIKYDIGLCN